MSEPLIKLSQAFGTTGVAIMFGGFCITVLGFGLLLFAFFLAAIKQ